jgi:hypothetical protein
MLAFFVIAPCSAGVSPDPYFSYVIIMPIIATNISAGSTCSQLSTQGMPVALC